MDALYRGGVQRQNRCGKQLDFKFRISDEAFIWNPKFGIWNLEDYWDSVSSSNTIAWNGQLAMQMPHSMQMVTSISFLSGPSLMALSWQLGMQAPH
jgi:hypothetical protein